MITIKFADEITSEELVTLINRKKDIEMVDVREDEEVAQGMIENSIHIPLQSIPNHLKELNNDKHYIFICRSGNRSLTATIYAGQQGVKASNLIGGVLEWPGELI